MDGMQKNQVIIINATTDIGKVDVKDTTNVVARNVTHKQMGYSIVEELCGGNPISSDTWDNFSNYKTLQP